MLVLSKFLFFLALPSLCLPSISSSLPPLPLPPHPCLDFLPVSPLPSPPHSGSRSAAFRPQHLPAFVEALLLNPSPRLLPLQPRSFPWHIAVAPPPAARRTAAGGGVTATRRQAAWGRFNNDEISFTQICSKMPTYIANPRCFADFAGHSEFSVYDGIRKCADKVVL